MGCVISKKADPVTPAVVYGEVSGSLEWSRETLNSAMWSRIEIDRSESGESGKMGSDGMNSQSFRLGNFYKNVEGEQVAAGWPAWLSAVAREAIQGWIPLRAESFEKLEKIGKGAYSSVFKARYLETGKFVALKKAHFNNFEPTSVRFMAREIVILRRLNHPNIIKLEGLITSRSSCSIYLVFEYMEHDLAGLSSSPDIIFSESQVKCYMHQLLSGLEHCHSRSVLHRDIKCANLLINNEGILKIADFGLSNFYTPNRHQLTNRVVTLWYRPPELLLGATQYEPTIDLWSVGCVFAEIFLKKPILQGRTEVEQIHKIFKLCGSPPAEYWKKCRFPHETLLKPQQAYESCFKDTFGFLPHSAYKLLETFLSIEPQKRGTATAALSSEYFRSKPYASDPSSLPKYPPNKEIDGKNREELLRMKPGGSMRPPEATRRHSRSKRSRASKISSQLSGVEEALFKGNTQRCVGKQNSARVNDEAGIFVTMHHKAAIHPENGDLGKNPASRLARFSEPMPSTASNGFKWAKKKKDDRSTIRPQSKSISKGDPPLAKLDSTDVFRSKNSLNPHEHAQGDDALGFRTYSALYKPSEVEKGLMVHQWVQHGHPEPYGVLDYQSHDSTDIHYKRDALCSKPYDVDCKKQDDRVKLQKDHELLAKHEQQICRPVRRSRFQRGNC